MSQNCTQARFPAYQVEDIVGACWLQKVAGLSTKRPDEREANSELQGDPGRGRFAIGKKGEIEFALGGRMVYFAVAEVLSASREMPQDILIMGGK